MDTEGTSTTEESVNLVDTVDNPALDWVRAKPRGIASIYSYTGRKTYKSSSMAVTRRVFKEISKS